MSDHRLKIFLLALSLFVVFLLSETIRKAYHFLKHGYVPRHLNHDNTLNMILIVFGFGVILISIYPGK